MKLTDEQRAERERVTALIVDSLAASGYQKKVVYGMVADWLILWGIPTSELHLTNLASKGRQKEMRSK